MDIMDIAICRKLVNILATNINSKLKQHAYVAHLTGVAADSKLSINNTTNYQAFIIQSGSSVLSLLALSNGNTPNITDVKGSHDFTITVSDNRNFDITVGAQGKQYEIYSAEEFTVVS